MTDFSSKTFGVISLGCDKNRVDSERLLHIIKSRGCALTDDPAQANVIVVNTCAFIEASREEAIDEILDCSALKRDGVLEKLVVTGCMPQKFGGELERDLYEADLIMGTEDYDDFFEALEICYEKGRTMYVGKGAYEHRDRVLTTPPHYAYLRISDGCDNRCTYCLIPKIKGAYRSERMENLIAEAKSLGDVKELILVAQDVTRYGIDIYGKPTLVLLLKALCALPNIGSVRLLYCYPDMISDELLDFVASEDKMIKYLDIPLQHSCDRILKMMNRPGTKKEYLDLIKRIREKVPSIALRSTFIAGFPTETEEEIEGLCDFLREAKIENCGFFSYSREAETPAYRIKGQIDEDTKERRCQRLYDAQWAVSNENLSRYVGKTLRVLCDYSDGETTYARAYFQAPDVDGVVAIAGDAPVGEYCDVVVDSTDGYDLFAHRV